MPCIGFSNNYNKGIVNGLLVFLLIAGANAQLFAQRGSADVHDAENLWSLIESALEQQTEDTAFHFMIALVRAHCGSDLQCQIDAYMSVVNKMEQRFNLPGCIFLCNEMTHVAQQARNAAQEAAVNQKLFTFHNAMGNLRQGTIHLNKALELFQKTGNQQAVFSVRMYQIENMLEYRSPNEIFSALLALLEEARIARQQKSMYLIRYRLVVYMLDLERYAELPPQLDSLAQMPVDTPYSKFEYAVLRTLGQGKAEAARMSGNVTEARHQYHVALDYAESVPDHWWQIKVLLSLATLEWDNQNSSVAKAHLQKALDLAESLELHDLLEKIYRLKARFAEEEFKYADALKYIKREALHKKKWDERSAGFDQKSYRIELERNQLASEKEKQELELKLRRTQFINFTISLIMSLLLAGSFFLAYAQSQKRKRALAEQNALIQQQATRLESLDAAKSRFFANVSHELRTPLTLLLGPIQTLIKENHLTEKQSQLLQMADRSGKQLEQLVNEILDLRKLEAGKMTIDEKHTALRDYFLAYFAQFESLKERKQIDFSVALSMSDKVVAGIDREKGRQILYNLLSNAFKFTPVGGQISATVSLKNGHLQLEVSDSGPGIHPDDLPHVFDRFFQTNRPDKPAEGGTGIGLALCKEYAQLFGGTIAVESTLGQGAVFRVNFPVTVDGSGDMNVAPIAQYGHLEPNETAITPLASTSITHHPNKPTILLVEDNLDLQDYIRFILQEQYNVITAENGQVALDKLPKANCQLVLSDLMMPIMDGFQLLERLKSDDVTRHIPVIMLTARAEAQDRLKALRVGVDDYMTKPFDEEELLVRIENMLKNQTARQEALADEVGQKTVRHVMSQPDLKWLESFEVYVQKCFSSDMLTVSVLAHEFAMSESTLLRQLKRLTGLSPVQYLQEVRLNEARRLLENRSYNSVAQVASKVGYQDARTFARSFRQRFGKLPSEVMST